MPKKDIVQQKSRQDATSPSKSAMEAAVYDTPGHLTSWIILSCRFLQKNRTPREFGERLVIFF